MLTYILFIIGFILLIKGAEVLVDGSVSIARRLNISDLAIGLTVVSIGSSSPELIVNIIASLKGSTELAIGNVLGSNIANILLGLGIAATVYHLKVQKNTVWKEIPFSLLTVMVIAFMANDVFIDGAKVSAITRSDGLVLLSFFIIFIYYIYSIGIINNVKEVEKLKQHSLLVASFMIFLGIVGLTFGGKWVVECAKAIGKDIGISEALVGLTIVAIGTSLPEIATSTVAAYKRNADIAVGNVVGSNIFNILWVLGLSSVINPIPFRNEFNVDILMVILATTSLFFILFIGKKHTIDRWKGIGFIIIYGIYILYLVNREIIINH